MTKQIVLKDFRSAGNGSTALCYHHAGNAWVCGDSGGSVYTITYDNVITDITASNSPITSMALSPGGDTCAITSDKQLDIYEFPDVENVKLKLALRTTLDITHTVYDREGSHIFLSSKGPDIDIFSCENGASTMKLKTQNAGARTFAVTADSTFICIADDSSAILIYSLKSSESALGRIFTSSNLESRVVGITSTTQVRNFFEVGFKLSWLPHESILAVAVPSPSGVTTVFCRTGGKEEQFKGTFPIWEEIFITTSSSSRLTHGGEDINIAVFSPNGRYLATADCKGVVLIWDVLNLGSQETSLTSDSFSPINIFSTSPAGPLYDIVWGQRDGDNYLMLVSPIASSVLKDVIDVLGGSNPPTGPLLSVRPKVLEHREVATPSSKVKAPVVSRPIPLPSSYSSSTDLTEQTSPAPQQSAAKSSKTKRLQRGPQYSVMSDEADIDDDDMLEDNEPNEKARASKQLEKNRDRGDEINDDDDGNDTEGESPYDAQDRSGKGKRIDDGGDMLMSEAQIAFIAARVTATARAEKSIQRPAFHPSSTSFDEKKRRFLVWNSIGNITCSDLGINNRIEIRFTSSDRNKPEAFNDNFGFTMASLSYEGAIFASDPEDDLEGDDPLSKTAGSTLYYHAFAGQQHMKGANETFTVNLNSGEAALAVAVGQGWSAVATSHGLLRLFSSTGIPLALLCLKGSVITMIGYAHQLAVYYTENDRTMVEIMEISSIDNKRKSVLAVPVALSSDSYLQWVGFNVTNGTQVTVDTKGITRILLCSLGWQWTPVLDLNLAKRTPDHTLWPVTVKGNRLSHVLLNGESRPSTYPLPVTSMKGFRMPTTESKEGKDRGVAQNDRTHSLLWESSVTAHFEAIRGDEIATGVLPEGVSSDELEKRLADQQLECDKTVLILYQLACQQQRTEQAMDYAHRLRTDQALASAMQIANHFGRTNIANAVDAILTARNEIADDLAWQQQQQEEEAARNSNDHMNNYEDQENADPVEQEVVNSSSGALSRKSNKNRPENEDYEERNIFRDSEESVTQVPSRPVNPFARQSSPPKRKSLQDSMRDLKGSPSPKKAALSRMSSFSQNARSSVSKSKNFL